MGRGGKALALAALALLAAGCGSGKGTITGEVTYKGKPIAWGRITFVCQEGKQSTHSAHIIKGQYKIENCPIGPVKISVESFVAYAPPADNPMVQRSREAGYVEPPADVVGKDKYVDIPKDYGNSDLSGLEYTVTRGDNTHNIDLKPK